MFDLIRNPATTQERDVLNSFTVELKALIEKYGQWPVKLRDGRWFNIEYFEDGTNNEYKMFRFVDNRLGIYLVWELCGTSITSRDFDMIEMENDTGS